MSQEIRTAPAPRRSRPEEDLAATLLTPTSNDWCSGFTGAVSIKNTGTQPINGWTLTWTWTGSQQMIQSWNSTFTQSGQNVALTNAAWNGTIGAGNTLSDIGFNANYSGRNQSPTVFYVNGTLCQ